MKNLGKLTLKEVGQEMSIITHSDALGLKGGDGEYFVIQGGVLINYDGYCVYYSGATVNSDGSVSASSSGIVFEGVNAAGESPFQPCNSAYQLNGSIHLGSCYNWSLGDFVHEYGHYVQQEQMGDWDYYTQVALPSMQSTGDPNHMQQSYEQQATQYGESYMQQYYPGIIY